MTARKKPNILSTVPSKWLRSLRVAGALALTIITQLFLIQCDKTEPPNVDRSTAIDSINWLYGGGGKFPIDLDKDQTPDIILDVIASTSASGSQWGSARFYSVSNSEIAFLIDSFTYHYCCDTCYFPPDSTGQQDTLIRYINCDNPNIACHSPAESYMVAFQDLVPPPGAGYFLKDTAKLYQRTNYNPPGFPFPCPQHSFRSEEGPIQHYSTPAYIYLRWDKNGTMEHYAIDTRWTTPYLIIQKTIRY